MSAPFLQAAVINSDNERVSNLKEGRRRAGWKKSLLAAPSYYATTFFTLVVQAPDRTSASHQELGSGILGSFFTGRPFLGVE